MGKVLIAAFDDKDEIAFDELLLFLKSNSHIKVVNAFPNDSCLKYDNLIIDSKYRMVEADGKSIELTNYEFEILYLLARHPGQVFSKEQIYNQVSGTLRHRGAKLPDIESEGMPVWVLK